MSSNSFLENQTYDNVYLVFLDAAGHSNVVKNNPQNISVQAFDLLFERIQGRLQRVTKKHQCGIGVIWSWLGDGGLIAFHDDQENIALKTVIEFAENVLNLDLPAIQSEFKNDRINGELHMRIAVHKGTIKFTNEGQEGFIHSSNINWGAHLEKVTPRDSVSISKDVYTVLPNESKDLFTPVGIFEDREVYIYTPNTSSIMIKSVWRSAQGFQGAEIIQCYLERISQKDKAELIDYAQTKVIDFGTTLNTCSGYLFSTERPVPYRDAVCRLLERGGSFVCYMLEPGSNGSRQLVELRKEDTEAKLNTSILRFKEFKEKNPKLTCNFSVFQYAKNPNMAAMIVDPDSDHSLCLYSPYLNGLNGAGSGIGRADMPHYLVSKKDHRMYYYIWNYVSSYMRISNKVI